MIVEFAVPQPGVAHARFPRWVVPVVSTWLVSQAVAIVGLLSGPLSWSQALSNWDGNWYLAIARGGYGPNPVAGRQSSWPFFPALPSLLRLLGRFGLSPNVAAGAISRGAFLIALVGLWWLVDSVLGSAAASWAVVVAGAFPTAFVFSMTYPSSLYLAASIWAVIFVRRHRYVIAGLCAAMAVMARPNGFALVVLLVVLTRGTRRSLLAFMLPIGALVGWTLWCAARTGDAWVFVHAKAAWSEVTLLRFVRHPIGSATPHMALFAVALAAVVVSRRWLPRDWLAFAAVYVLPALVTGIEGIGRYAIDSFPVLAAMGYAMSRLAPAVAVTITVASAAAMVLFAHQVSTMTWLP